MVNTKIVKDIEMIGDALG